MYQGRDVSINLDGKLPGVNYTDLSAKETLEMVDAIPRSAQRELNHKLFDELEGDILALKKLMPRLRDVFGDDMTSLPRADLEESRRRVKERYFFRDLAIKIKDNPEIVKECQKLSEETKDKIIDVVEHYLTCRKALIALNDNLIFYYFQLHPISDRTNAADLEQTARLGVIKAVDHFDPNLQSQFSSYALQCIHTFVRRQLAMGSGLFRYYYKTGEKAAAVRTMLEDQKSTAGYADPNEIAKELDTTETSIKRLLFSTSDILFFSELNQTTAQGYLESKLAVEHDRTESLQKKRGQFLREVLPSLLEGLTERERTVLIKLYGLFQEKRPKTFAEIAEEVSPDKHISRQTIEQTRDRAIRKIMAKIRHLGLTAEIEDLFFNND